MPIITATTSVADSLRRIADHLEAHAPDTIGTNAVSVLVTGVGDGLGLLLAGLDDTDDVAVDGDPHSTYWMVRRSFGAVTLRSLVNRIELSDQPAPPQPVALSVPEIIERHAARRAHRLADRVEQMQDAS